MSVDNEEQQQILQRARQAREIEEAIRRQMLAERAAAAASQAGAQGPYGPQEAQPREGKLSQWQKAGGILGTVATVLLLVFKLFGPLVSALKFLPFGKFLITGGSMLISMFAYAASMGWPMGVGLVLSIFVHECGHAYAARRLGMPFSFMVFVPFMGAMVAHKRGTQDIVQDAYVGIMGPVWGTLFGIASVCLYWATGNPFFLTLAWVTFFLNLFNLAPMAPLDGGWIVPLFSPKLLAAGVVLLFIIAPSNPLIWILALMSLPRVIAGWKAKPGEDPYYHAPKAERLKYGLLYVGLALFLAVSYRITQDILERQPTFGNLLA